MIEVINHDLRNADARQPLEACGIAAAFFNVGIGRCHTHSNSRKSLEPLSHVRPQLGNATQGTRPSVAYFVNQRAPTRRNRYFSRKRRSFQLGCSLARKENTSSSRNG